MTRTDDILAQIDDAIEDWSVGPDAMRSGAPAGAGPMPHVWRPAPRFATVMITADLSGFRAAMDRFAAEMAKVVAVFSRLVETDPAMRKFLGLPRRDEHHPAKLPIDGVAYARRRRARKARR